MKVLFRKMLWLTLAAAISIAGMPITPGVRTVYAQDSVLLSDDFEDGLGHWTVTGAGAAGVSTVEEVPPHNMVMAVSYQGQDIHIARNDIGAIANQSNLIYEIEFWDAPDRDYGLRFSVSDADGDAVSVGVDAAYSGRYFVGNGDTTFDSQVNRTAGWHNFQIYVTDAGSYAAIDGQSLVYVRSKITDTEVTQSFPINSQLTRAAAVVIEYPDGNGGSLSYWDNFRVSQFRITPKTVAGKEEDLLIEFLEVYEDDISAIDGHTQLAGVQNYQLARLALAAAFGVRARRTGNAADWTQLETLLTEVVEDYPLWQSQHYEAAISSQAIAQIASWRWAQLNAPLRQKIVALVTTEADRAARIDPQCQGTPGDSKAEENAWFASLLGFAADFFPDHTSSNLWRAKALALATMATSRDDLRGLNANYCVINHGLSDHPSYALTIPLELAQADLFRLNRGLSPQYTNNMANLYLTCLRSRVRGSWDNNENWTYRGEGVMASSGRDDWSQDATLQDSAWAYLDRIPNAGSTLDAVVNYAWLTRSAGAIYPDGATLMPWLERCGDTYCDSDSLHFLLNAMDAYDRFVTLFMIDRENYQLRSVSLKQTVLLSDDFEDGLGHWTVTGAGAAGVSAVEDEPPHNGVLGVSYQGQDIHIARNDIGAIANQSNLIYEIEFWDAPDRDYGLRFSVSDADGDAVSVGVHDAYSGRYFVGNGDATFDSLVDRTAGWHSFQIHVTDVGSYATIDGTSVLTGTVAPDQVESILLTSLTHAAAVAIEYPDGKGGSLSYWDNFQITVMDVATNVAPLFTSVPITAAVQDTFYTYAAAASDANGDALTLTAPTLPGWLALTDHGDGTAALTGTPSAANLGAHSVVLRVSDGELTAEQAFTVTVVDSATNVAPLFTSVPITAAVQDTFYTYAAAASDANGDALTLTAPTLPGWLALTDHGDGTAALTGTPSAANLGAHSVVLRVSDGELTAEQAFTVTVGLQGLLRLYLPLVLR